MARRSASDQTSRRSKRQRSDVLVTEDLPSSPVKRPPPDDDNDTDNDDDQQHHHSRSPASSPEPSRKRRRAAANGINGNHHPRHNGGHSGEHEHSDPESDHGSGLSNHVDESQSDPEAIQDGNDDDDDNEDAQDERSPRNAPAPAAPAVQADFRNKMLATRSEDGYLPGSIRRIALSKFQTYDYVEFRPGPYLNMIIGPNGTGKSTISYAIVIGLGFSHLLLGKARDLSAFVKRGETQAWVEIELQAPPGDTNPVVRRFLNAQDNSSDYRLNGKAVKAGIIKDLVADLNIDAANLCSFLPQEKVAEFAHMTPSRVLVETQKAAGQPKLTYWHNKLIEADKLLKDQNRKLQEAVEEKSNLEERNSALRKEVHRFEERNRLEKSIRHLESTITFVQFKEAKAAYEQLKLEKNAAKKAYNQFESRGRPIVAKIKAMAEQEEKLKARVATLQSSEKRDDRDRRELVRKHEELGVEIETINNDISNIQRDEDKRKTKIRKLKEDVAQLEQQVASQPTNEDDASDINAQIREINQRSNTTRQQIDKLHQDKQDNSLESRSFHNERNDVQQRLANLENVKSQRLENIRKADLNVYNALMWLRENQSMFQKPVYEPIMLEIDVTNRQLVNAVESCINFNIMKTFVCQTRADYDLFAREVIDKRKMRVTVAEVEGITLDRFQPPIPEQKLAAVGFDGYVSSLISGPPEVLVYLCQTAYVHTIPVCARQDGVDPELVAGLPARPFKRFIAGDTNYTITWSRYGSRRAQIASRRLRPARTLAHAVDRAAKEQLDNKLRNIHQSIKALEEKNATITKQEEKLKKQMDAHRAEVDALKQERTHRLDARRRWEKAKIDLDARKRLLQQEESRQSADAHRQTLLKRRLEKAHARVKIAQKIKETLVALTRIRAERDQLMLQEMQMRANARHIKDMQRRFDERLAEVEDDYVSVSNRCKESKVEVLRCQTLVQDRIDEMDEDMQHEERGVDELRGELAKQRAAYDLTSNARAGVVDDFEKRQREIERLSGEVDTLTRSRDKNEQRMAVTKAKWLPALTELITRVSASFSAAFQRLGCAGEVQLAQHDDYDKWGIEILVKFRDTEDLQRLTGSRQSGGERSLTTIFYLMSLIELSRSPFSLVDEINQGMDPRAERNAHNELVQTTCSPNASQYFLITPKLLSDLKFHPRMKTLIVMNGDWLPKQFDFREYVSRAKSRSRIRAGTSNTTRAAA